MKSKNILLTALMSVLPLALMAQQNIQEAFDALLNEKNVEIKTQHTLERDPETGKKEAQADVYDIMVVEPSARECIKDIQRAFEKDKENAYSMKSGDHADKNYVVLGVGDGKSQGVAVGRIKDSNYIYACFMDKDDPEKKYRYAYALEWADKGKQTQVRLAVTYATTQQYRQGKKKTKTITVNGTEINIDGQSFSFGNGFPFDNSSVFSSDSVFFYGEKSSDAWLSEFNTYKNLFLKNPDSTPSSYYATFIYKLCKNVKALDEVEKNLVATEIAKLRNKTNDEFIQQLFDMSIERLKK